MAAGRIDVRRREDFYQSNRKSFYSKNGYNDLGFNNRGYDCDVNRRDNRGKSRYSDTVSRFGDEEPTAKKTKFSPVGFVRKEIRVSSKNRIVKKRTTPSPPKLSEKVSNFIVDDLLKCSRSTIQVQAEKILTTEARLVASDGLTSFSTQNSESCGKNDGDEEVGEFQTISKSRWAHEEYSRSEKSSSYKDSLSPRERVEVDTPESGEICERKSSGSSSRSERSNDEVDSDDYTDSCLDSGMANDDFAPEPRRVDMLQSCRSVCEYERLGKISEGTYGIVYKARDKKTGEIVALKKVKMGNEREGFPLTALREINLLLALHHPSIVDVKEVVMDSIDDIYMVMEYIEYDLKKLIEVTKQPFTEREVKCLMLQLLEGIKDCHDNWILHRDLKTSNILISKSGKLKICDFGMSRQYGDPLKAFTTLVVTLWYRAPELLLGAKKYSTAVDMWSVGCIMGELLAKKPLFDGDNEVRQLDKIFRTLGTPTEATWPGLSRLPGAKANFAKHQINTLRAKFPAFSFNGSPVLSERGFDLLSKLLTYDPEKRITVDEALAHDWFSVESKQELVSAQETLAMKIKTLTYGY